MKILLFILLFSCACLAQSGQIYDWADTRFGLTEQELVQMYGARLKKLPAAVQYRHSYVEYVIPNYTFEGRKYNVEFEMNIETKKLSAVFVKSEQEKADAADEPFFRQIENLLSKKYGIPANKSDTRDSVYTSLNSVWRFEAEKRTIIQLSHYWSPINKNFIFGIRFSPIYRETGLGSGSILDEEVRADSVTPLPDKTNNKAAQTVKFISKPKPVYTDEAKRNNITGTIKLNVTFQADGTIGEMTPVEGLPFGLTEKAVEAARLIKFEPAKKDGVPYAMTREVVYNMVLY